MKETVTTPFSHLAPVEASALLDAEQAFNSGELRNACLQIAHCRETIFSNEARDELAQLTRTLFATVRDFVATQTQTLELDRVDIGSALDTFLGLDRVRLDAGDDALMAIAGSANRDIFAPVGAAREKAATYLVAHTNEFRAAFQNLIAIELRALKALKESQPADHALHESADNIKTNCRVIFESSRILEERSPWRLGKDVRGQLRYTANKLLQWFGVDAALPVVPIDPKRKRD